MKVRLALFLLFASLSIPCVSKEKIDSSMCALDVACLIGDRLVKETPFAYKLELESNSNIFNGIQKVDFEYSVSGNELEIAKVVALRKRKTMCKIQINEIERLEKDDTEIKKMRFLKTFIAARDIDSKDENYFAVFNSPAYGRCLLVFTPNEDILNGMKPHLNKNIVVQLFYKRKMS